jgi:hypothetical protein
MSDWAVGFAIGIAVGLAIGISVGFGRRQKPWSEQTSKEKKVMIALIAAGVVLLLAGIVVSFLFEKQL